MHNRRNCIVTAYNAQQLVERKEICEQICFSFQILRVMICFGIRAVNYDYHTLIFLGQRICVENLIFFNFLLQLQLSQHNFLIHGILFGLLCISLKVKFVSHPSYVCQALAADSKTCSFFEFFWREIILLFIRVNNAILRSIIGGAIAKNLFRRS